MENNVTLAAVRDAFTTVASYATAHAGFPVVLEKLEVLHGFVFTRLAVDGRELEFNTTQTGDAASVARVLAVHTGYMAGELSASIDVADLWNTWWTACNGDDARLAGTSVTPVEAKLEEVQDHVLAAVESDAEHIGNLLKLAEVLRDYDERVRPADCGQIIRGMVETALASDNGTWFVEPEDFIGEGAWHPEAWAEFLEDLEALRSRLGADKVDDLIVPAPGFDPTNEATWPADGIAATFYGDFLKLFDTADFEA